MSENFDGWSLNNSWRRLGALCSLFVLILCVPEGAHADKPILQLQISSCVNVNYAEVGQLLSLRLKASLVTDARADAVKVFVDCQNRFLEIRVDDPQTREPVVSSVNPKPLLELRVEDPVTGKTLRRFVDLSETPPKARDRLLAVAIAELVTASWAELAVNPNPEIPPVGKIEASEVSQRARSLIHTAHGDFGAFASMRFFSRHAIVLPGLGVDFRRTLVGDFFWAMDSQFLSTKLQRSRGELRLFVSDVAVRLGYLKTFAPMQIGLSLAMRGGMALLDAEPKREDLIAAGSVGGPWFSPEGALRFALTFIEPVSVGLDLASGYTLKGLRGRIPDAKDVRMQGPWAQGAIRLVMAL